jgi:hypothetical protein
VVVGQHIAAPRIDNDARAEAGTLALARHVRHAEEMAEHRIAQQGMLGLLDLGLGRDVDHARRHPLQHGRKTGQGLAVHHQRQGRPGRRRERQQAGQQDGREISGALDHVCT